jgi:transposase-like protein
LSAKRDQKAALRFIKKAIRQHGVPEKINTDKSGANAAGLNAFNENYETDIELRQVKYLNNIVEQDHRRVRQRIRPMLGLKSFMSAAKVISGIEMICVLSATIRDLS